MKWLRIGRKGQVKINRSQPKVLFLHLFFLGERTVHSYSKRRQERRNDGLAFPYFVCRMLGDTALAQAMSASLRRRFRHLASWLFLSPQADKRGLVWSGDVDKKSSNHLGDRLFFKGVHRLSPEVWRRDKISVCPHNRSQTDAQESALFLYTLFEDAI